ncbi:single-stranded DNA-binding protein [Geoalkalibacter halelectricus]|uniref:single-stranded DNA-binding protein n=1 Tax=Geoalkalibacter halelectricus TaxID=2847045 RepID=UPI003D20E3AF
MFASNGTTNMQIFMGNVGKAPFVSQGNTPSGRLMAAFPLALDASYKDRSGQKIKRTHWIDLKGFGKTAEFIRDFVRSGQKVFVISHVETRKIQGQNGRDQYVTDFIIDEITFAGANSDHTGQLRQPSHQQSRTQSQQRAPYGEQASYPQTPSPGYRQGYQQSYADLPPEEGQEHPHHMPPSVPAQRNYPQHSSNGNGRGQNFHNQAPPAPNHYGGYPQN